MANLIVRIAHCLCVTRGTLTLFKGAFSSDVARQVTQVHVFEESRANHVREQMCLDGREGYQRPATKNRQEKFAQYLDERGESQTFAPPVVLNARGKWRFEAYDGTPEFGAISVEAPANVIDGQHRRGGFISHFKKHETPRQVDFVAYQELTPDQEKWVFHTINTTQKGVPPSLQTIINDHEWHNRVAREIAEKACSPFVGQVDKTGLGGTKFLFKLSAIAKNVKRMFDAGQFDNTAEESKFDMFVRYWDTIRSTHTEAWDDFGKPRNARRSKLLELTGLIAYCRLFQDRFKNEYNSTADAMNWGAVEHDLEHLAGQLNLSKEGHFKGQTGEYGAGQILRQMQAILARRQGDASSS